MTSRKTRSTTAETSQQGTLRTLQEDIQQNKSGTNDRIDKLQSSIEKLISGMQSVMNGETPAAEGTLNEEEEILEITGRRGVFRNPSHAALIRQREGHNRLQKGEAEDEEELLEVNGGRQDIHTLRHLKLSFPVFKEGSEALEWLRDCEEYFSIYEVVDRKRAAIAVMHLSGVPRSWYKSFMIGRHNATWGQFTRAFLARFGEADTELVFDKFKKLQQVSTVEAYFDDFEKCRGQLLMKIPGLTNEYFLENFIGGLQNDIRGMLRLLEPVTLEQALKLARYYEQTLGSQPKKRDSSGNFQRATSNTNSGQKIVGGVVATPADNLTVDLPQGQ